MGPAQRTLLSVRGLIAFLESTAVGYASKNARDELRVVHITESEEQGVFLAKIDVQPRVKRIALFPQGR